MQMGFSENIKLLSTAIISQNKTPTAQKARERFLIRGVTNCVKKEERWC